MCRVVFAWEPGANYGHLARDLLIAEGLRDRGCSVLFVVRDLWIADEILTPRQFAFIGTP